jgi:hypothetical protein
MQLQPVAIDVRELTSNVIAMMQPVARAKELKLLVDLTSAPEEVVNPIHNSRLFTIRNDRPMTKTIRN